MFRVQELVNYLNNGLNGIDTENAYSFNIYAEIGGQKDDGKINGVLRTTGSQTSKVKGNSETHYTFVCEMPIVTPVANKHFLGTQEIIEQFVETNNGAKVEMTDGSAVLHISMGMPKDFKIADNTGATLPLYFTIEALYTENNVTNADKHWFLGNYENNAWNYYEIPYTNENVLVDKDGIVRKINDKNFTQAFLTGQTKYYKFVFPYQKTNLGKLIQTELLSGKFQKEFKLKYYDGVSFTAETPFETTVSIYKNGDTGSEAISSSHFNLTFADVDDGSGQWVYKLALIDNRFDNQTEDTRWFNSQAEQQAYYEEKVLSGCAFVTIKAPNLNSLDITSQVYPNTQGYNVFDLTNKNYAIIKASKSEPVQQVRYFYYWVTNAQIGANGQVMFDLSLDTVQTYLFDSDIEFGDCLIERSCLNRFVDNGNGTVSFDGGVDSKLFAREKIQNVPKRLTKRTKLGACNILSTQTAFNNWINDNVLGWVYVFISPTEKLNAKLYDVNNNLVNVELPLKDFNINTINNKGAISQPLPCVVFPILKAVSTTKSTRIKIRYVDEYGQPIAGVDDIVLATSPDLSNNYGLVDTQYSRTIEDFIETIGVANVYSSKFTTYCPFSYGNSVGYSINENDGVYNTLTIKMYRNLVSYIHNNTTNSNYALISYSGDLMCYPIELTQTNRAEKLDTGILVLTQQRADYILNEYTVDKTLTFTKNEIINANKDPKYNPKLLGQDYFELQVCDETENGFTYDLQKLNNNKIKVNVTESLTPDNTKKYIRVNNATGVYITDTKRNLTGFVSTNDNSIVLASSKYADMLANNKNYFTQNALNRYWNLAKGVLGLGQGAAQGAIAGSMAGAGGAVGAAVNVGIQATALVGNAIVDKVQENMSIDNLKNAPASIQQALGNCYFGAQYTEPGTYVEEYDILPQEKKVINDYMVQYGYSTNQIGQIKDYLNTNGKNGRKYFNYIQAIVNSISGIPMSNTARQNLRERFAKGIRFWKDDKVNYDLENYELWLEANLNGTTWLFNDDANFQTIYNGLTNHEIAMNFKSNGEEYTSLRVELINGAYEVYYVKNNTATSVCVRSSNTNTWQDNKFKTIEISTGNTDAQITSITTMNLFRTNAELLSIKR